MQILISLSLFQNKRKHSSCRCLYSKILYLRSINCWFIFGSKLFAVTILFKKLQFLLYYHKLSLASGQHSSIFVSDFVFNNVQNTFSLDITYNSKPLNEILTLRCRFLELSQKLLFGFLLIITRHGLFNEISMSW